MAEIIRARQSVPALVKLLKAQSRPRRMSWNQVGAPTRDPKETLNTIRQEIDAVLPGAVVRRQVFFRYTIVC